jgi:thymidylate synthase (FAD)
MPACRPRVTLVRHTPEAEELLASAARLCYASETEGLLRPDPAGAGDFVRRLLELGHLSPVEHAAFTFYLEGVSRALTHQLVRHRVASYSQRSQRYVRHDDFAYVVPPALAGRTVQTPAGPVPAAEYFAETMALLAERYRALNQALGASGEESNQDARYILPNACETKIFVTMNARELVHFFEERLCRRAQWEIRHVADEMLRLVRRVCPHLFNAIGPKCVRRGGCPEGALTCGEARRLKREYLGNET